MAGGLVPDKLLQSANGNFCKAPMAGGLVPDKLLQSANGNFCKAPMGFLQSANGFSAKRQWGSPTFLQSANGLLQSIRT